MHGRGFKNRTYAKMASEEQVSKTVRRNRPGTKTANLYGWPEQDYNDMDTTLAGQKINRYKIYYE